jgi:uncharacterized protein YdbL (DUF1318 family)
MATKNPFAMAAAVMFALAACLTVNVYFYPSEEVDQAAQEIIEDIRGSAMPGNDAEGSEDLEEAGDGGSTLWRLTGIAYAAGRETKVSSPAIDALEEKIRKRFDELKPFFEAGAIGETNDGLVEIRDASVLPMKDRARLNRIVKEENADRKALYEEVAKELGVEAKDMPKLRRSFAEKWQEFTQPGWWVQDVAGNWRKR